MFAHDRDLLALEPNLFRDVGWVGQRVLYGLGGTATSTGLLTLTSSDIGLVNAGVGAGYVALVDSVPYEVIERVSDTVAQVSRLRASVEDDAIPPVDAASKTVIVTSFRPQLALVHDQVLRMMGIEPADPVEDGKVHEGSVLNPASFVRLEAFGAMHLILSAAGATAGPGSVLTTRAELYRARFHEERQRVAARIDLDGDGVAEATRRLNIAQFVRG